MFAEVQLKLQVLWLETVWGLAEFNDDIKLAVAPSPKNGCSCGDDDYCTQDRIIWSMTRAFT